MSQVITYYPVDSPASGGANFLSMQRATPPITATGSTGWTVGTVSGTQYSSMASLTKRASSTFGATLQPSANPNSTLGDCYRSSNPLWGSFVAGNWTLSLGVIATARAGATGRASFAMWKSPDPLGVNSLVSMLAAGWVSSQVANLQTTTAQASILTNNRSAFTFSGEYLFVQVAWEIDSAGPGINTDVMIQNGPNSYILTPLFTPTWPTLPVPTKVTPSQVNDPPLRLDIDSGYVQTRPRYTRQRRNFDLLYEGLTLADMTTLYKFITDNLRISSLTFQWTNPWSGEVFPKVGLLMKQEELYQFERIIGREQDSDSYYRMPFKFEERF